MSSAWHVEIGPRAQKALRKMDRRDAQTIYDALKDISTLEDPRSRGKGLTDNLAGLWRYRVGDWRIICNIEDGVMVVLVVDVAHRSVVYGRRSRHR